MEDWTIEIQRVDNGYIVIKNDPVNPEAKITEVFEEEDDIRSAITDVLYEIADYFGFMYQKFDENNLSINWDRKGHKL